MKRIFRSKLALTLAAFLMIAAAIVIPLSGNIIGSHAQAATITPTNITGQFYQNVDPQNGVFNISPPVISVFNQPFNAINFNPAPSMQHCSSPTNVDQSTRPFTNVVENSNGSCSLQVAQGNGAQAGVDNSVASLQAFEAVFFGELKIPGAGTLTTNITSDDGFILSIGPLGTGQQPVPAPNNPMNNTPATSAFKGYTVDGGNNQPSSPTPFTISTNFPTAGTYPFELDYTECCNGSLSLVMSNTFTLTTPSAQADLMVSKVSKPTSLRAGKQLRYEITVINKGPSDATGVTLTDNLPGNVFVDEDITKDHNPKTSQGQCTSTFDSVTCNLGKLANGASATVTIIAIPNKAGTYTNSVTALANEFDPNMANNTGTATTTVQAPLIPFSLKVDWLNLIGTSLKGAALIADAVSCLETAGIDCHILATELLAQHPGATGKVAEKVLTIELSALCGGGLALASPELCLPIAVDVLAKVLTQHL